MNNQKLPSVTRGMWAIEMEFQIFLLFTHLILLLRGIYTGLRLTLYLKINEPLKRLGLILLGVFGYYFHACRFFLLFATFYTGFGILEYAGYREWLPGKAFLPFIAIWILHFLVTYIHKRYRVQAQANYDADPYFSDVRRHLENANGNKSMFHLAGRIYGFLRRKLKYR